MPWRVLLAYFPNPWESPKYDFLPGPPGKHPLANISAILPFTLSAPLAFFALGLTSVSYMTVGFLIP
jgi:hypothetical protein